jgi:hypothetical protein
VAHDIHQRERKLGNRRAKHKQSPRVSWLLAAVEDQNSDKLQDKNSKRAS